MIATPRIQRRYDHRLQAMVESAGSIEIALEQGIPRSTARGWLRDHDLPSVVSIEVIDQDSSVNFFHLDCLSSEVRLNVDLDAVLTVLANGCYRWLASKLHGFDNSKPKSLYRKFVETSGTVEIAPGRRILVHLNRRAHNPILREAQLDQGSPKIPWLANYKLEFIYS